MTGVQTGWRVQRENEEQCKGSFKSGMDCTWSCMNLWGEEMVVVLRSQELSQVEADTLTSNKCISLLAPLVCQALY